MRARSLLWGMVVGLAPGVAVAQLPEGHEMSAPWHDDLVVAAELAW